VLLHVVEAPLPVDRARGALRFERRFDDVRDAFVFVDHVQHANSIQRAEIGRLPA
jgi:hypothetical protein